MVSSFTAEFNVSWHDPADAEITWMFDPMHLPHPMCTFVAEFWDRMFLRYMNSRTVYVNGYSFSTPPLPRPPTEDMIARGVFDVWTTDYLPRIKTTCDRIRRTDYAALSLNDHGNALEGIVADAVDAFGYTMKPIAAFMGPTFEFVGFLEAELGPSGPRLAATLLQGFENGTAAAGAGLGKLAESAASRAEVADALRRGDFDAIESAPGGSEFIAEFRDYLEEFGWRVDSWGLLDKPTWAENPHLPLTLIAHYISDPERSPRVAHERSVRQREDAVREVEASLEADKLPAFRSMLATVQSHVPVSEGRALWQLIIVGSLRVPLLDLGRKLVAAGALDESSDVFLFTPDELAEAAAAPSSDTREVARQRRAAYQAWHALTPPPFVGAPPDPSKIPPEIAPLLTLFFGMAMPDVSEREIKGQAASKGVVTARARVITDLSDAERLQPGEVLVCTTTAPPWTPLFAIAAAVVTDAGGVLSHSAICAREYAIPCVVATQVGTQVIKDGATITVDGTNGVVRISA
jgi:pyruvate,water dikinase